MSAPRTAGAAGVLAFVAASLAVPAFVRAAEPAPAADEAPDAATPPASTGSAAPATTPTSVPPPPGYAHPPYGYPAPYPYPYPYPPVHAYPGYPAYPPYPAYSAYPPPAPPAPPAPLPTGKWRIGGSLMAIGEGRLSYDLRMRGESLLTHERGVKTTAGLALFVERDLLRYLYVGFAFQIVPSIKWKPAPTTEGDPFTGSASQLDFLPQLGGIYSPTPRLRILGYAAPGFSLLDASDLADIFASSGTPYGFALQVGGGILYALGAHAFLSVRGAHQWTFLRNEVKSHTTNEHADVYFRFRFFSLQGSAGYWF